MAGKTHAILNDTRKMYYLHYPDFSGLCPKQLVEPSFLAYICGTAPFCHSSKQSDCSMECDHYTQKIHIQAHTTTESSDCWKVFADTGARRNFRVRATPLGVLFGSSSAGEPSAGHQAPSLQEQQQTTCNQLMKLLCITCDHSAASVQYAFLQTVSRDEEPPWRQLSCN